MLSVPWSIQTFSSTGCSKLMNMHSIALSQVCYKEPLAIGKVLPNPETFCPRPASWQQFSPKFHNSVQSFIFWFDITKIPSASTLGQFRKHWKKMLGAIKSFLGRLLFLLWCYLEFKNKTKQNSNRRDTTKAICYWRPSAILSYTYCQGRSPRHYKSKASESSKSQPFQ